MQEVVFTSRRSSTASVIASRRPGSTANNHLPFAHSELELNNDNIKEQQCLAVVPGKRDNIANIANIGVANIHVCS